MHLNVDEILKRLLEGQPHVFTADAFPKEIEMWMTLNTIPFEDLPLYLSSLAFLPREIGTKQSEGMWHRGVALRIKSGGKSVRFVRDPYHKKYEVEIWEKE